MRNKILKHFYLKGKKKDSKGEASDNRFILANTQPINYGILKNTCIMPVFSKDNESTVSHTDFVDAVGQACENSFPLKTSCTLR